MPGRVWNGWKWYLTNKCGWHIIYLTRELEGECRSPDPAKFHNWLRIAVPKLWREQDGYFLFFRFRIATISKATLTIRLNSSYVLIIITTLRKVSDWVRARPPVPWVSILYCHGAVCTAVWAGKFYSWYRIRASALGDICCSVVRFSHGIANTIHPRWWILTTKMVWGKSKIGLSEGHLPLVDYLFVIMDEW